MRPRISPTRLDSLIEEAIVDAYNESEQAVGFHATLEQHLTLPFETVVPATGSTAGRLGVDRDVSPVGQGPLIEDVRR